MSTPQKILVVDDEPDLQMLMLQKFRSKVRNKEYEFLFAEDGVEALEIIRSNNDLYLVMSDINMPKMDGLTMLNQIQDMNPRSQNHYRIGLWRYGKYSHGDELWCLRFCNQADRL